MNTWQGPTQQHTTAKNGRRSEDTAAGTTRTEHPHVTETHDTDMNSKKPGRAVAGPHEGESQHKKAEQKKTNHRNNDTKHKKQDKPPTTPRLAPRCCVPTRPARPQGKDRKHHVRKEGPPLPYWVVVFFTHASFGMWCALRSAKTHFYVTCGLICLSSICSYCCQCQVRVPRFVRPLSTLLSLNKVNMKVPTRVGSEQDKK